jgi:hypothetical protein
MSAMKAGAATLISVVFSLLDLGAAGEAAASQWVGLWKVDATADGIVVDFPDGGFSGACVRLANGAPGPGEIRVESQIVRHRFDSVSLVIDAALNPEIVHAQVAVKNASAWAAQTFYYENTAIKVPLDGQEFAFQAKKLQESDQGWEIKFCRLELANQDFTLRFTSDCAGYDFEAKAGRLTLLADEDWVALEREMSGGMGFFSLTSSWLETEGAAGVSLDVANAFPSQLFYVALARDGKPIVEAMEGEAQTVSLLPEETAGLQFVVKTKTPTVGEAAWKAVLARTAIPAPAEPAPESAAGDSVSAADAGTGRDGAAESAAPPADANAGEQGGEGGCSLSAGATPPAAGPGSALLALLGWVLWRRKCARSPEEPAAWPPERPRGSLAAAVGKPWECLWSWSWM